MPRRKYANPSEEFNHRMSQLIAAQSSMKNRLTQIEMRLRLRALLLFARVNRLDVGLSEYAFIEGTLYESDSGLIPVGKPAKEKTSTLSVEFGNEFEETKEDKE
jgi:hypothetical protein